MGQSLGCPGSSRRRSGRESSRRSRSNSSDEPDEDIPDPTTNLRELERLLQDMQQHNLKRMKLEIDTDIHTFILNNLLMCIQFFDNFERSKELASQFKRKKESEINHRLSHEPLDRGTILGERRCHLLHGMSHVLATNYIYRPPDNVPVSGYAGGQIYGMDSRNTFICEGILPLEFFMTWDNLELYQSSEWDSLHGMQYSAAKGSVQILRFCMEEPDKSNKVPRGFIRLRSVDVTADIYKSGTDSSYDYAYHNGRFSDRDRASEADSASHDGLSDIDGSDIDRDEFVSNVRGQGEPSTQFGRDSAPQKPTPNSKKQTGLRPEDLRERPEPFQNHETGHKVMADRLINKRLSAYVPQNYSNGPFNRLSMPDPVVHNSYKNEYSVPTVTVNPSNTPPIASTSQAPMFHFPPNPSHSLIPPQAMSKFGRHSFSMSGLAGSSTSGYDTSYGMSRSSSLASEDIRFKWQQLELKQLADFPMKNRVKADLELEKHEPLSFHCFIPVKTEVLSDSEEESDTDSLASSYTSDGSDTFEEIRYQERYYLNSTYFSSEFCSEFYHVGMKLGLPPDTVSRAVILGTTIRCSVPYESEFSQVDSYRVAHTFTPSLHSKFWPPNYYFWFNQRMFNKKITPGHSNSWPSKDQVESIEKLGANAIPIGFRSLEFFNTHQSLEWQLNFGKAETLLLNSFKHVHWRAYIFASLIFRAFLAPLGPQGIGVEHIRNILYFMCHEDFVGWNDEQPGLHLRTVLSKLFDCLGKGKMPNFFIQSQDLLKTVPSQNARLIQGHLSHLRDNLLVYCIYAFRNLTCLKQGGEMFPTPNFKRLYDVITAPTEIDVIKIQTPHLVHSMEDSEEEHKKEKKNRKKKSEKYGTDLISKDEVIESEFRAEMLHPKVHKHDKEQSRLRRKHLQYEQKMREIKARERDLERHRGPPEAKIPTPERRKSIDLKKLPVIKEKFSVLRKVLVIQFFIEHFLEMAKQCNEHRSYSQSAMYIMQVENLCSIIIDSNYDLGKTSLDVFRIEEYREQCSELRKVVGGEMREYVLSRFSHLNVPSMTSNNIIGELSKSRGPFQNNWDFRKLPTPPGSHVDDSELMERTGNSPTKRPSVAKKLEVPNIAMSLQSFNSAAPETAQQRPSRQESIKFIDKAVVLKRSTSRQSIVLLDMEKQSESTDL